MKPNHQTEPLLTTITRFVLFSPQAKFGYNAHQLCIFRTFLFIDIRMIGFNPHNSDKNVQGSDTTEAK